MEQKKQGKNGVFKKIWMVLISFGVMGLIAALDPNVSGIGKALAQAKPWWLLGAFVCAVMSYVFNMLMHLDICRIADIKMTFFECATTTMVGFFYNALTPMQIGGQPMQVFQMRGYGVPVGSATSITLIKYMAWQFGVVLIATVGMIVLEKPILALGAAVRTVVLIGYAINILVFLFAAIATFNPKWLTATGKRALAFLKRHRIIRKEASYAKAVAAWDRVMSDYAAAVKLMFTRRLRGVLPLMFFGFMEIVCFLAVTYFIYRGFSLSEYPPYYVVLLQSLLSMAVSFIPIPGGAGASEGGFYLVFGSLFSQALRFPAMLLWRMLTYYLNILLGLVFIVVDGLRKNRRRAKGTAE
ncbi:MAG: lysylphosphatidylglycerol synthase transmembrane domain-containing protein [Clostridiaceae bacterium]